MFQRIWNGARKHKGPPQSHPAIALIVWSPRNANRAEFELFSKDGEELPGLQAAHSVRLVFGARRSGRDMALRGTSYKLPVSLLEQAWWVCGTGLTWDFRKGEQIFLKETTSRKKWSRTVAWSKDWVTGKRRKWLWTSHSQGLDPLSFFNGFAQNKRVFLAFSYSSPPLSVYHAASFCSGCHTIELHHLFCFSLCPTSPIYHQSMAKDHNSRVTGSLSSPCPLHTHTLELITERLSLEDREHRTKRILENRTREINRTLTFFLTLLELPVYIMENLKWWRGRLFSMTVMVYLDGHLDRILKLLGIVSLHTPVREFVDWVNWGVKVHSKLGW